MDYEFQTSSSGNNYTSNKLAISNADAFWKEFSLFVILAK